MKSNFIGEFFVHFFLFLDNIEDVYAFNYISPVKTISRGDGWDSRDPQIDFKRMKVPNDQWTVIDQLSETEEGLPIYNVIFYFITFYFISSILRGQHCEKIFKLKKKNSVQGKI